MTEVAVPADLVDGFGAIARTLLAQADVADTLQKIVELAVVTIDGCDHAAVSVVHGTMVETEASTGDLPRRVDELQYATGQGPCLDAIRHHEVFRTDDLGAEDRWPDFSARAVELGARSMLAFRLFVEADTMGALNLYSSDYGAFDHPDAERVGSVYAAYAAVAWSSARHQANMAEALRTRDLIGQAKGILMATRHLSEDQAFEELREASQRLNMKLRDIAADVTYTGAPPAPPPGPRAP